MNKVGSRKISLFFLLGLVDLTGFICSMEADSGFEETFEADQTERVNQHLVQAKAGLHTILKTIKSNIERLEQFGDNQRELDQLRKKLTEFEKIAKEYQDIIIDKDKLWDALSRINHGEHNDEQAEAEKAEIITALLVCQELAESHEMELINLAYAEENRPFCVPSYLHTDLHFKPMEQSSLLAVPKVCCTYRQGNILQLAVLDQRNINGGGAASCGYHAFKNCAVISRLLLSEPEQQLKIVQELTCEDLVAQTFGSITSSWRHAAIIEKRKRIIINFMDIRLQKVISAKCRQLHAKLEDRTKPLECVTDHKTCCLNQKCKKYHGSCCRNLHAMCTAKNEDFCNKLLSKCLPLQFKRSAVVSAVYDDFASQIDVDKVDACLIEGKKIIKKYKHMFKAEQTKDYYETLKRHNCDYLDPEEIIRKFEKSISRLTFLITKDAIMVITPEKKRGKEQELTLQSDWLDSVEMAVFLHHERKNGNLFKGLENVPLLVVEPNDDNHFESAFFNKNYIAKAKKLFFDNAELTKLILTYQLMADRANELEEPDPVGCLLRRLAENLIEPKFDLSVYSQQIHTLPDYFHNLDLIKLAVLIRDETTHFICPIILQLSGHWIAVVVNKVEKTDHCRSKVEYIIANSTNRSCINNDRVTMLINFLEGKEPETSDSCILF